MRSRLLVEREVLAQLMGELDPQVLRRRLRGLRILGVGVEHFSGAHTRAFQALGRLAEREEWISPERVAAEAPWGVDGDYLRWLVVAYADAASLAALADELLATNRRARAESALLVALNAVRDPAGDFDRALGVVIGSLRRLRRGAAA